MRQMSECNQIIVGDGRGIPIKNFGVFCTAAAPYLKSQFGANSAANLSL
jgi:hypothetical protein